MLFDVFLEALGPLLPLLVAATALALLVTLGPRLVATWRQRAYDEASAAEELLLTIAPPPGMVPDPELATELIRAVHPRQRRGFDAWRVGWPSAELSVIGRGGEIAWEVVTNRQMAVQLEHALRALYPGAEVDVRRANRRSATATAVGRLAASASWPLGEARSSGARVLNRFAAGIEQLPDSAEVRLRLIARPLSPERWRREVAPVSGSGSSFLGQIMGAVVREGLLFQPSTPGQPSQTATESPEEREARARKRRGVVGFDVGLILEVGGVPADEAEALLWRLADITHPLADGRQAISWKIRRGAVDDPPRARLADWELAQLWYLPDASFDRAGFVRDRPLAAPPPPVRSPGGEGELGLVIAESRGRPLAIPVRTLSKHLAVLGATGSGKSTLLLNLALGAIEARIGTTVVDPHGDLVGDIACRILRSRLDRVHVLRLSDLEHPRGFNFLERREPRQDQLVASEFVYMFEDLWPRFCGPKMQHYLRNGLLTLLADDRPQTILELVRILTEDGFRQQFIQRLRDPMLRSFWATQWPGGAERDRDASIKAVLNKRCVRDLRLDPGRYRARHLDRSTAGHHGSRRGAARGPIGRRRRQRDALRSDAHQPLLRRRHRPAGDGPAGASPAPADRRRGAAVRHPSGREHLGRGPQVRPGAGARLAVARRVGGADEPHDRHQRGDDRPAGSRRR